jgi:hypothetical protein
VIHAIDVLNDLMLPLISRGKGTKLERSHLLHSEVPVIFYPLGEIDQAKRNHPILDLRWVGVKREYLEFNRIELIYRNRGL